MIKPNKVFIKELKDDILKNDEIIFMGHLRNSTMKELDFSDLALLRKNSAKKDDLINKFKENSNYVFTTERNEVEGKFKWVPSFKLNEKINNAIKEKSELNKRKTDIIKNCTEYVSYEMSKENKRLSESSAMSFVSDLSDISNDFDREVLGFVAKVFSDIKDPNEIKELKNKISIEEQRKEFVNIFFREDKLFYLFSDPNFDDSYKKMNQKMKNYVKDIFFEDSIYNGQVSKLTHSFDLSDISEKDGFSSLIKDVVVDERFNKLDINDNFQHYEFTLKNLNPLFSVMANEVLKEESNLNAQKLKEIMLVYAKVIQFGFSDSENQRKLREEEFKMSFEVPIILFAKSKSKKEFILSEFKKIEKECLDKRELSLAAKLPNTIKEMLKDENSYKACHKDKQQELLIRFSKLSNGNKAIIKEELSKGKYSSEFKTKLSNFIKLDENKQKYRM